MTPEEIEQMLRKMEIPCKYNHFTQKEMETIDLPIIVWNIPETKEFHADGIVYHRTYKLDIELYTDEKDWGLEKQLENILNENGITWKQTASEWLESESMWESLYEMEV